MISGVGAGSFRLGGSAMVEITPRDPISRSSRLEYFRLQVPDRAEVLRVTRAEN